MAGPDQALADLTEISSQVEAAALFDAKGGIEAATLPDANGFVRAVQNLMAAAAEARSGTVTQLDVTLRRFGL